jgi:hypothetical protein
MKRSTNRSVLGALAVALLVLTLAASSLILVASGGVSGARRLSPPPAIPSTIPSPDQLSVLPFMRRASLQAPVAARRYSVVA